MALSKDLAPSSFSKKAEPFSNDFFEYSLDFGGDRLPALGKRRRRSGHHLELLFAVFLEIIELVGQFYPLS